MRVLSVVKRYMTKFDASCVVHTDCQRSAINAFRRTFGAVVKGDIDNVRHVRHCSVEAYYAEPTSRRVSATSTRDKKPNASSLMLLSLDAISFETPAQNNSVSAVSQTTIV